MNDNEFLQWLQDRIINVYGESPNTDFVLRLEEIRKRYWAREPREEQIIVLTDDA
jgi:hypothetical protein